jgi:pyruvate,water dikinase
MVLKVLFMCEIPSIDEFCEVFDGFSIGSNDLTQLVLGIDRDSAELSNTFDECNTAVKRAIRLAIQGAHLGRKSGESLKIGLCGQAPSDKPEFARFLVEEGIDSISLTPDAVIRAIHIIADAEKQIKPKT